MNVYEYKKNQVIYESYMKKLQNESIKEELLVRKWKNGVQVLASKDIDMNKITKILDQVDKKIKPTEDYSYKGRENNNNLWNWPGLFGMTDDVVEELEDQGFKPI